MSIEASAVPLAMKLYPPRARTTRVRRPRLLDALRAGLQVPLTLVTAPAGWGKSSLVADWIEHDQVPAGWLSLDRGDSDPMVFWRYLFLAVGTASQGRAGLVAAARAAGRRLSAAGVDIERDVLPPFINAVLGTGTPLVLVLDDFHLITGSRVPATVSTLLDRCPANLHLVLISRAQPRLTLSRLRLAGDLVEIRARDLAFSAEEAVRFFTEQLARPLASNDVERLVDRTEGWAAGLQLAALRLRERDDDPAEFIARFTGADRHVVDYLSEEVLSSLPADQLTFLLQTSVLERFCAPLADAVTGRDDAARMLEQVARADLFLIPLDDEHRWFRYHHLFGGLLRHELSRIDRAAISELHRRAADWFAAAQDHPIAIRHALATGDDERVVRSVSAGWRAELNAGRWDTVRSWLATLPAELVADRPALSVARAWVGLDSGRFDEVAAALSAARAHSSGDAHLQLLQGLYAFKMGDLGQSWGWLSRARPDGRDPFVATVHSLVCGLVMLWSGRLTEADRLLLQAERRASDDGNPLAHLYAVGSRALVALGLGDQSAGWRLVAQAEDEVIATMSEEHFVAMCPALVRTRLALARLISGAPGPGSPSDPGHLPDQADLLDTARSAIALARRGASRVELSAALLTAAALANALRPADLPGDQVRGWVQEARELLDASLDAGPVVTSWLAAHQRRAGADTARSTAAEPLTERELAVLRLLPGPLSQRQLADSLFVTPNTLKTHLRAIYRKLGAQSRSEAVLSARRQGLI